MSQPKTIYWRPHEGLKYPSVKKSGSTWLIYTQAALKLDPYEKKTIALNFGVFHAGGLILVVPSDEIKKNLEFKNPFFCENRTDNIVTTLYNFSKSAVLIPEKTPLCFIKYLKP